MHPVLSIENKNVFLKKRYPWKHYTIMKTFFTGFYFNLLLKEISPFSQITNNLYNLSPLIDMWSKPMRVQLETFRASDQQIENGALYVHCQPGISLKMVTLPYLEQP